MRPTRYGNRIKTLINEELNHIICEIFNTLLPTEYSRFNRTVDGYKTIVYRFKTKSNSSYDLEFFITYVNSNDIMDDGSYLYEHIKQLKPDMTYKSIDIGFTLSDRVDSDDEISVDVYNLDTNKNESIEVMSRIGYLINEFRKEHNNINIFVIGRNTKNEKLNMYKKTFSNIFSNDFNMIEGEHYGYSEGALYFIKTNIYI